MIGVTAAASAGIYFTQGFIDPALAMPAMLGVLAGSLLGAGILAVAPPRILRRIFSAVVLLLGIEMLWKLEGRAVIQFGLGLLIATPVARVVFSLFAFIRQRDGMYVVVTSIVLAVLLLGLFSAQASSSMPIPHLLPRASHFCPASDPLARR